MNTTGPIDIGISSEVVGLLKDVFADTKQIKKVLLFGSRAKGNYHRGSDIDLAVIADEFSFEDMIQLQVDIDELDLLYKVDCVDYHKIDNDELIAHIDRVGIPLFTRT